jgi:hypothetical protein
MKDIINICCLMFILHFITMGIGCNKNNPPEVPKDEILSKLNWIENVFLKNNALPESNQLVNMAISKWQNGALDPEPFLLYNQLHEFRNDFKDSNFKSASLSFYIYDEEKDIVGLIIEEEHTDSQGTNTSFQENYPIFLHYVQKNVLRLIDIKVYMRNGNKKNEEKWQEYANKSIEQLKNEFKSGKNMINTPFIDTLPKVWISIPEPNKVNVNLYVYDKNGNISQPLKLRYIKD